MYLASIAEQVGYNAKIKDYRFGGNFINDLLEFKPDFLVVTCSTQTFKFDLETILLAKNNLPTITTIAIGTPFWTYNKNVTYENPYIDYVIFGEAEYALKEILSGEENRNILGISYSENMQTIKNDLRPHIENLDELPFPARHLIDNSKYKNFNHKELAVVQISRGCPFNQFYDLKSSITGFNIRPRSIDNIINEIQECIEKYNINNFLFQTENFNFDKDTLYIPLDVIKQQGNTTYNSLKFSDGVDFLIKINGKENSTVLVDSYYDVFQYDYSERLDFFEELPGQKEKDSGYFNSIYLAMNKNLYLPETKVTTEFERYNTGVMKYGSQNKEVIPVKYDAGKDGYVKTNKYEKSK